MIASIQYTYHLRTIHLAKAITQRNKERKWKREREGKSVIFQRALENFTTHRLTIEHMNDAIGINVESK